MEWQDNTQRSNKSEKITNRLCPPWWITVGLIIAGIGLIISSLTYLKKRVTNIQITMEDVQKRVERVEEEVLSRRFTISTPVDGVSVDFTDVVRGMTPFPNKNNYIVVTPLKTGDDWVQDGPVKIYGDGLWTGIARFGTGEAGVGEEFLVRAIATQSALSPGPLTQVPKDAVFSEAITVTRK